MNNTRPFIVFALILGVVVAVAQIFMVFFAGKNAGNELTAESITLLPAAINVDQLTTFTERAGRYLMLTPKQFEDGVDPTGLNPDATPTPTPSFTP